MMVPMNTLKTCMPGELTTSIVSLKIYWRRRMMKPIISLNICALRIDGTNKDILKCYAQRIDDAN